MAGKRQAETPGSKRVSPKTANAITVCHLADVHLGYRRFYKVNQKGINQRELDVCNAFEQSLEKISQAKPDVVLIAGDLFHSVRPSNRIISFAFRQISNLSHAIQAPIVIIAGNHDTARRSDAGSVLTLLAEIENVFVATTKVEDFQFPEINTRVVAVPYTALPGIEKQNFRADSKYEFNLLVCHAQVNQGWASEFDGAYVPLQSIAPHEWDYIALGHVHERKDVAFNASYSGSIECTSSDIWSEALNPKGVLKIELPAQKRELLEVGNQRTVIDLGELDLRGADAKLCIVRIQEVLEELCEPLSGAILRLRVQNISPIALAQLDYSMIRKWRREALHFELSSKVEQKTDHDQGSKDKNKAINKQSLFENLNQFCLEQVSSEQVSSDDTADIEELLKEYWRQVV